MALSACVDAFILTILCGNPILKGAFVTLLTGTIVQIDGEITLLIAQLARLNFANQILNFEIQAIQALLNNVQADLNLFLVPLQQFPDCPELSRLNEQLQNNAVSKTFMGLQKKLYELNRAVNLVNLQNSLIQQKQKLRNDLQEIVDRITILCP